MPDLPPAPPADTPPAAAPYASIDVGTNSVKMVIADLSDGGARRLYDSSVTTRLGEGMQAQAGRLREVPMRRTLDALAGFVGIAREQGVRGIAAVGTAALREAANRDEFLRRAQERCGLAIDVISGEEEARLSYLAVRRDPHWRAFPRLLVIDIGGGSTEIIEGEPNGDAIAARRSVSLGAVKLTERYLKSDPPTVTQLAAAHQIAAEEFGSVTLSASNSGTQVVGVGGTMTNLAAIALQGRTDPESLHGHTLRADALEDLIERFASRTVAERKQIPGLDPARADIILGGAILLSQALAHIGATALDVSTRGLRWGVLYDRFAS
jgi:exopolyphosphatase/guanosine-5'-triphosphate,3'-diphosphate pyrophosphatase